MIAAAEHRRRLDLLLGLWNTLVDPKVGVVRTVYELPVDEDDPAFFHYISEACDASRFNPFKNFNNNGGAATSRRVAMAKALGEAVERYCAAIFRRDELRLSAYQDLDCRAAHPALFSTYRPEQFEGEGFPWHPFGVDSPVHWTRGQSLLTGDELLVPAAAVYIPYYYPRSGESAFVVQPISTGVACGSSFARAALSGLCEVVERDAFTITWQARLSRRRLRHDTLPALGKDLMRRFASVGLEVHLMDITTDFGVPTLMAIGLSDASTSPALALAAATHPSPERALVKCLEELAHTRKYAKHLMEYVPELPVEVEAGHPTVKDQVEHLRFYCPQFSKAFAEFAWASPETCDLADLEDLSSGSTADQLGRVVQRLADGGLECIACDLTTDDIAPLGLRVVRMVAPGAHPMFMGYRNRALGNPRLYEVPGKLGFDDLVPGEGDNPYPHPFP